MIDLIKMTVFQTFHVDYKSFSLEKNQKQSKNKINPYQNYVKMC